MKQNLLSAPVSKSFSSRSRIRQTGGGRGGGCQLSNISVIFPQKLHENKENLDPKEGACILGAPSDPPLPFTSIVTFSVGV